MNLRLLFLSSLSLSLLTTSLLAGEGKEIASPPNEPVLEDEPYRFSAEFTIEQAYLGGSDVERGNRQVNDFDEYYSNLLFVYTPRIKFGILRLGAQWERYSFGFPHGGQQLPNTLQAVNSIVGLDTKFSDSILVRLEAQPGFYETTFDHLEGDSFNVPFVIGGTYIYTPELQFVLGVGVNLQSRLPVIPGGGIRWKFASDWVLNAVLPTPRLEYQLNHSLTLFAGADIKANTFRVDDHFGDSHGDTSLNSAWLSYEEVRLGAGAEWKMNSSISLSLEGGYVPWRQFDFHRTEVRYHYESGAPYAAVILHGEF
jgi:opacity protein-like surface antigen